MNDSLFSDADLDPELMEIERKKKQDQIELEEKRFIERAKVAINTSLVNAQDEYVKKEEKGTEAKEE